MTRQQIDFSDTKIQRVNKDKNLIYIWEGGQYIKVYNIHAGKYTDEVAVRDVITDRWVTYSEVKKKMRELIEGEKKCA